jgi:predicted lipoprotein with Yx(FWY)xxD motif
MRIRHIGVITMLVLGTAGLTAACGSSSSKSDAGSNTTQPDAYGNTTPSSAGSTTTAGSSAAAPIAIGTVDNEKHVVNSKGFTVYAFNPDTATASKCNAGCDTIWPPVIADGTIPSTIEGLPVTTLTRDDGKKQVVVNGHPVYTYAADTKVGDKNGQGVGGNWYYLDDKGEPDKG